MEQAIELSRKKLGEKHPNHANHLNNLASLYEQMDLDQEARELYEQAIAIDSKTVGEHHPQYATHVQNLARWYANHDLAEQAIPLLQTVLLIFRQSLGENHLQTKMLEEELQHMIAPTTRLIQFLSYLTIATNAFAHFHETDMIRVAIIGAAGLSGVELLQWFEEASECKSGHDYFCKISRTAVERGFSSISSEYLEV